MAGLYKMSATAIYLPVTVFVPPPLDRSEYWDIFVMCTRLAGSFEKVGTRYKKTLIGISCRDRLLIFCNSPYSRVEWYVCRWLVGQCSRLPLGIFLFLPAYWYIFY